MTALGLSGEDHPVNEPNTGVDPDPAADRLQIGDVVLDRAAYLANINGRRCVLARKEFRLLETLMLNADRVLSSKYLLESVWGTKYVGDPGTVAVHILRLRKKLERELGGTRHLRTIRGVGYIFDSTPV